MICWKPTGVGYVSILLKGEPALAPSPTLFLTISDRPYQDVLDEYAANRIATTTPEYRRWAAALDIALGLHFKFPRCCIAYYVWVSWKQHHMAAMHAWMVRNDSPRDVAYRNLPQYVQCDKCYGETHATDR